MITTSSMETYEKCYALCNRGNLPGGTVNRYGIIGDNLHLSELAACVLMPQLEVLDAYCQHRETVLTFLDNHIAQIPGLNPVEQFPDTSVRAQMSYAFYVDPTELGVSLAEFVKIGRQLGIPLAPAHKSVSSDPQLQNAFGNSGDYPVANATQEALLRIHHTAVLKGKEYWEGVLDQLFEGIKDSAK
jgi:dTDP-4-amino-4,6-dideoxygalactose transaminase